MSDEQERIRGYRILDSRETDLINRIKQHEAKTLALADELLTLNQHLLWEGGSRENLVINESNRWVRIAKTDIQTGFMALVRAVGKPEPVKLEE